MRHVGKELVCVTRRLWSILLNPFQAEGLEGRDPQTVLPRPETLPLEGGCPMARNTKEPQSLPTPSVTHSCRDT
jgi:hypothetical protein